MRIDFYGAIKRVVDTSPTLDEYRARIGEATARIREAQTPAYPRASFDATYTRLDPAQVVNFGGQAIHLSTSDNYNLALTLQQAILTFGRLKWGSLAAKLAERSVREEYRAQLEQLMARAADTYIAALLAAEEVNIYRRQLESRQISLRDAEALFRSGTVARFDVLRAASEVSNARQELLVAENAVRLTRANLATLMDFPPGTDLELEGLGTADPPPTQIEQGRERALARRPEIRAVQWAVEASQARMRFENSQDNPSFGLQAVGFKRNVTGLGIGEQWNTSLVLSVPIYDGGLARARTQAATEVIRQLQARLHGVRRDVSLDVEKAWLDMHTRWERIRVATQNLEQAEEAGRVARVRYNAGVSTSVELLDAETALTRARQGLASARFFYFAAQVAWARAISTDYPIEVPGPLPTDEPIPETPGPGGVKAPQVAPPARHGYPAAPSVTPGDSRPLRPAPAAAPGDSRRQPPAPTVRPDDSRQPPAPTVRPDDSRPPPAPVVTPGNSRRPPPALPVTPGDSRRQPPAPTVTPGGRPPQPPSPPPEKGSQNP